MKVYVRTANNDKSSIEKIKSTLQNRNHKVDTSIIDINATDKDHYSSTETESILKYDFLIVEASVANAQLGYEAAYAIEKNIPVAILYSNETGGSGLFPLMAPNPKAKLVIKGYKLADLEETTKDISIEFEDLVSNRFTLSFTPQISNFLNWITTNKKTTRSDFIRSLIENAMKKNTEYKKLLKD